MPLADYIFLNFLAVAHSVSVMRSCEQTSRHTHITEGSIFGVLFSSLLLVVLRSGSFRCVLLNFPFMCECTQFHSRVLFYYNLYDAHSIYRMKLEFMCVLCSTVSV